MYEQSRLSSLDRLVGKAVSAICFVENYVEVVFEELVLTCYTMPIICVDGKDTEYTAFEYRNELCRLIGRAVEATSERLREELSVYFNVDSYLRISLEFEDGSSVEAAMLHERAGTIFNIWRYE